MDSKSDGSRSDRYSYAIEKQANATFEYVADIIEESRIEEYEKFHEQAQKIKLSTELDVKLKNMLDQSRKDHYKNIRANIRKHVVKIAVVLFAFSIIISILIYPESVQGYRLRLFQLFIEENNREYNVVDFSDQNASLEDFMPDGRDQYYYLGYVPETYDLMHVRETGNVITMIYSSDPDTIISFYQWGEGESDSTFMADNQFEMQGALDIETKHVDWYKKGEEYSYYWKETDATLCLKTIENEEVVKKILQNIKYKQ